MLKIWLVWGGRLLLFGASFVCSSLRKRVMLRVPLRGQSFTPSAGTKAPLLHHHGHFNGQERCWQHFLSILT